MKEITLQLELENHNCFVIENHNSFEMEIDHDLTVYQLYETMRSVENLSSSHHGKQCIKVRVILRNLPFLTKTFYRPERVGRHIFWGRTEDTIKYGGPPVVSFLTVLGE